MRKLNHSRLSMRQYDWIIYLHSAQKTSLPEQNFRIKNFDPRTYKFLCNFCESEIQKSSYCFSLGILLEWLKCSLKRISKFFAFKIFESGLKSVCSFWDTCRFSRFGLPASQGSPYKLRFLGVFFLGPPYSKNQGWPFWKRF